MSLHTDIMVDLETLDTAPGATVLSVGLVAFNLHDDAKPRKMEVRMGMKHLREQQKRDGRSVSKDTVKWWKRQSAEAQQVFKSTNVTDCEHACAVVMQFFRTHSDPKTVRVWGNGASFDNVILTSLLETYGFAPPWRFWNDRCHRTMKSEFKHLVPQIEFTGTPHNAADDAAHQVKVLKGIYANLQQGVAS